LAIIRQDLFLQIDIEPDPQKIVEYSCELYFDTAVYNRSCYAVGFLLAETLGHYSEPIGHRRAEQIFWEIASGQIRFIDHKIDFVRQFYVNISIAIER